LKISYDLDLKRFEAWSGADETLRKLTEKEIEELENTLEELYPDGMDETELNDLLRFEDEEICNWLCIDYEEFEARE
jgi:hypothetical protein